MTNPILINTILPALFVSTLILAILAYGFALGATMGPIWQLVVLAERR